MLSQCVIILWHKKTAQCRFLFIDILIYSWHINFLVHFVFRWEHHLRGRWSKPKMTEVASLMPPDHRLAVVRHYEAAPPAGLELVREWNHILVFAFRYLCCNVFLVSEWMTGWMRSVVKDCCYVQSLVYTGKFVMVCNLNAFRVFIVIKHSQLI